MQLDEEKLRILRGMEKSDSINQRPSPQEVEQKKREKFEEIIASAKPIDENAEIDPFGYPVLK
ncbi:MAG: hypothetical protein IKK52_05735 [Alphaproteobacteria bacterium]|nr:hypothetical protein [Alphaproteobacteria bacterium]